MLLHELNHVICMFGVEQVEQNIFGSVLPEALLDRMYHIQSMSFPLELKVLCILLSLLLESK